MPNHSSKRAKKPRFRMLKFRKHDVIHNLMAAAQHYIHANGGTAVVMGGVSVQEWPADLPYTYHLALRVTGKKPESKAEKGISQ